MVEEEEVVMEAVVAEEEQEEEKAILLAAVMNCHPPYSSHSTLHVITPLVLFNTGLPLYLSFHQKN